MSIRLKIILVFLVLTIPLAGIGYFAISQLNKIAQPIVKGIPEQISDLTNDSRLNVLAQSIRYYDEVLTQAARNYTFTKNIKWKNAYNAAVPELDNIIKEALRLGDTVDQGTFQRINESNLALVAMEEKSINLVDNNKQQEAIAILEGKSYWDQKAIYKSGLTEFADRRGIQFDQAVTSSTQALELITKQTHQLITDSVNLVTLIMMISVAIAIVLGIISAYLITKPLSLFEKTALEITKEGLGKKVNITSNDEIGKLANIFNKMSDKLLKTQSGIEVKVSERTAQLEKVNKYLTGRELRMIELKKSLKQAEEELSNLKNSDKISSL